MSGAGYTRRIGSGAKIPDRYLGSDRSSPEHEAHSILGLVRVGTLSIEQARRLIVITAREAANLRKILEPLTASAVFRFRRDVLRTFDALTVQPAKAGGRSEQRR